MFALGRVSEMMAWVSRVVIILLRPFEYPVNRYERHLDHVDG